MEAFTPENYEVKEEKTRPIAREFPMTRVFIWLGIGLLVTAVVSLSLPYILLNTDSAASFTTYVVLLVVSAIIMFPCMFIINMKSFKPKSKGVMIGYLIYAAAMGILLSSVFLMVMVSLGSTTDAMWTIGLAFAITSGCFLLMGLIGSATKKNLSIVFPLLSSLMIGCLVISLVNFFIGSSMVYWIVDFIMLGVILVVTAVDINRVKKLAENKMLDDNKNSLSIYCAFNLYVDFIYIFIRVLMYVLIFAGRRK